MNKNFKIVFLIGCSSNPLSYAFIVEKNLTCQSKHNSYNTYKCIDNDEKVFMEKWKE